MKARRVKGLDPGGPLAANAARIVAVRLAEVHRFVPAALDPSEVEALHDMRIAAKRLRYVLELTAHCFGPYAATAAQRAKELQDLLGEIHDCDVMAPRVRALAHEREETAVMALRGRAGAGDDLDPALLAGLEGGEAWRGLHALSTYLAARRTLLFERFLERWAKLEREGFRTRLEHALEEPASP